MNYELLACALAAAAALPPLYGIWGALNSGRLQGPKGERGERGERGPAGESAAGPQPAAPSRARHIAERLKLVHGEWVHDGWVREGSPAWQKAYDTPGYAVRSADRELNEGKQ
jgi:hypothetical protein